MKKRKIIVTIGTRPEAVKMAPLVKQLQREEWADCRVLATAQHRGMLDQVLRLFEIEADIDLDIMQPSQSLPMLTSRLMVRLDDVLAAEQPDVLLAQGEHFGCSGYSIGHKKAAGAKHTAALSRFSAADITACRSYAGPTGTC